MVIHFAGLKAVGDSWENPLEYYSNNIGGTISLLAAMKTCAIKNIIFSSSATVYGDPVYLPIDENHPTSPMSPYGRNKLQIEQILSDLCISDELFSAICLRYFNPVGCHSSGLIGEMPNEVPNNLTPYICQVASGRLKKLQVFGGDYDTPDGTCYRDYIHVMDLAEGHSNAIDWFKKHHGFEIINLGTGNSFSVLEMVQSFRKASNKEIPFEMVSRRTGDVPVCHADASKALRILGWKAKYNVDDMCKTAWLWEQSRQDNI